MKYIKKPVVIEAMQWTAKNIDITSMYNFLEGTSAESQSEIKPYGRSFEIVPNGNTCAIGDLIIKTLEGNMKANIGDYIIKGVRGEFYPCKPDIFEMTYEKVESNE